MLVKAGLLLLAVAVYQVSAEYVEPEFIEKVIARESADAAGRIVSGWEALPGQHPHQAALRMVNPSGDVSACGGSFVHREWVITAAHCTATRTTIVVRGGVVSLTTPEYIFETTLWWNYPTYDETNVLFVQPNDISIMKLERPVTFTVNLKPIRIQSSADAYRNYDNELVHTSGHGRTWTDGATTEVLRWVYLRAIGNPSCALTYGSTLITNAAICARWFNVTSQSTCSGDSGGPLVHVDADGVDTLIGVTSFVAGGTYGCHSGLPAGFVRPGPFLSWFKEISGIDFENLQEEEEDSVEGSGEEDSSSKEDSAETDDASKEDSAESDDASKEDSAESDDASKEDSSESNDDSSDTDEDSDEEMSQLLKRLQVNVKVKVQLNKFKVKKEVQKEKHSKKH